MDVVPHPVEIHGRINTVVLQQRHGDAGNGGGLHVGEAALQHAEARNADDGLDLPRLDERHHDGAALGDKHRIAETLGFVLEILNRALAALFAQQAKLIERRGAFAFEAQAFRHEQQPTLERHGGELLAPQLVVDQNTHVVAVDGRAADALDEAICVLAEFSERDGWRGAKFSDVISHRVQNRRALFDGLRDVFLRLTKTRWSHRLRERK